MFCSFSCESISRFERICWSVMLSRWPPLVMTSSNAKTRSKHLSWILSSARLPAISATTFESSRSVSRSSTMFDALFVMSSRKSDSIGWYT